MRKHQLTKICKELNYINIRILENKSYKSELYQEIFIEDKEVETVENFKFLGR